MLGRTEIESSKHVAVSNSRRKFQVAGAEQRKAGLPKAVLENGLTSDTVPDPG